MGLIAQQQTAAGDGLTVPYLKAGAPSAGTDEVWTLTIGGTPTGGTFTLNACSQATAAITWSSTNATLLANIQAALVALGTVNASGVVAAAASLTAGIGTLTLTVGGNLTKLALPTGFFSVGANNLTGTAPTLAIAQTTPGVTADGRGGITGCLLVDTTNKKEYINTGTSLAPTWTVVGSQT